MVDVMTLFVVIHNTILYHMTVRKGGKKGGGTAQLGSYWLGSPFFGRVPERAAEGV